MMTQEFPKVEYNRLYTPAEACKLLGICAKTLRNWKTKGIINVSVSSNTKRPRYKGSELLRIWSDAWGAGHYGGRCFLADIIDECEYRGVKVHTGFSWHSGRLYIGGRLATEQEAKFYKEGRKKLKHQQR